MTNAGLAGVPPPLKHNVMEDFQGLPEIPSVNKVGKGWNEFVLYADTTTGNSFAVEPQYYYLYIGMTWDDGDGYVLQKEGAGRGLFFRNEFDRSVEGFYCYRDSYAYFNWLCESAHMTDFFFDPEIPRMPYNRTPTSWWVCGAEDRNTYTQAQCRQQLVTEDDEEVVGRWRYDPEQNVEFWGLSYDNDGL